MSDTDCLSPTAAAVLYEIRNALENLQQSGKPTTLFIDKMGISPDDRSSIREVLGSGTIKIELAGVEEPASWLESGLAGIWYGVYFNQNSQPLLETIEINFFPAIAAAQPDDIAMALTELDARLPQKEKGSC